jgi:hypothetical protein
MQELRPIWRPQYASGHEALDQEHQALFQKLEDFLALLEQEGTRDQARAFDLLVGECATHFGHERSDAQVSRLSRSGPTRGTPRTAAVEVRTIARIHPGASSDGGTHGREIVRVDRRAHLDGGPSLLPLLEPCAPSASTVGAWFGG